MEVRVRAHVRASRARREWRGEVLHVWVTAPPVEGAANQAVLEAVAAELGVRPSTVRLVAGGHARDKTVEVVGVSPPAGGAAPSAPPAPAR